MTAATDPRAYRLIGRIRHTWAELDYAQRRLLEIRTGIPSLAQPERARLRGSTGKLEALWIESDRERQARDLPGTVR